MADTISDGMGFYKNDQYEQGDYAAQYNLGLFYQEGKGVARNNQEALRWFKRSASWLFRAALRMAIACEEGQLGMKPDPVEAKKWRTLSKESRKKYPDRSTFGDLIF